MENGQLALPSDVVVSKVPSQNSSNNTFLKNVDISTPSSKSPSSAGEKVLRRELDSEKQGSTLHDKLEELKKKNEATEEAQERTARQYDELKKHKEESDLILRTLLKTSGTSSQTWSCVSRSWT